MVTDGDVLIEGELVFEVEGASLSDTENENDEDWLVENELD